MSTFEAAYKSLLQGVSQQLPEERLPGQLTAQVNMVSDPVTNLRRRPGVVFKVGSAWTGAVDSRTLGWFTDIAGQRVHILLNAATGAIRILNEDFVQQAELAGGAYLTASDVRTIRATSVGNEFFLCNTAIKPVLAYGSAGLDPAKAGFFYIVSGAFGRTFNVTVTYGGSAYTASYTTPGGTGAGDAALSTPEYIATQLANAITTAIGVSAGVTVTREGPFVFLQRADAMSVNTTVGTAYMIVSKSGMVTAEGNLPSRLPSVADGYVCRVGSGDTPKYFKYNHATTEWLETGAYGSPTAITNCPISVTWTEADGWKIIDLNFEGRLAGDDKSNPAHEFSLHGITGMGTYQGRLVLLAGPLVSLSASGIPRRFFRSTVTSVLSSDPIEIGSGMNSSAAYEWAIPFQKDLLLFSRAYQALIPSGNTAITPGTATVIPTSAHEVDTTSSPITLGRTLMYCNPRSEDFFGVLEMLPSNYTDSQYVSQDSTPHLPKYMGGRCRFAVSSGVASMALFAPSGDPNSLVVHEYHWDGDEKVQQAWHMWTFKYPVAAAYFASDVIVMMFVKNGVVVLGTVDPRAGALNSDSERRPFLDLNFRAEIVSNVITLPAWLLTFDPTVKSELRASALAGDLQGELVGTTVVGDTLRTVPSWPSGAVGVGIPYYSGMNPTPPAVRDYGGQVIHGGKATLLRFMLGTKNSSQYYVTVSDDYSQGEELAEPVLTWASPELNIGRGMWSKSTVNVIPCRTDMRTTDMEISTTGTGELNVTSLEYVAKYNNRIKRR